MTSFFRRAYKKKCKCKDKKNCKCKRIVRKVRTYSVRYKDAAGLERLKTTKCQSLVAAKAWAAQFLEELGDAPAQAISRSLTASKFEALIEEYLDFQRDRWSATTLDVRGGILRFVVGRLGIDDPRRLTLAVVNRYVSRRRKGEWGTIRPQTVNAELKHLRQALTWMKVHGFILENPLHHWSPLRVREADRRRKRAMTPDEVAKLRLAAPWLRWIVWMVLIAAGMRRKEAINLLVSDFHIEERYIRVRAEVAKSGRERRCYLPAGVVRELSAHLARERVDRPRRQQKYLQLVQRRLDSLETSGGGDTPKAEKLRALIDRIHRAQKEPFRLLANSRGLPLDHNLLRSFKSDVCRAGIDPKGLCVHCLRLTCNTTMRRAGVSLAKIQARIGHCSTQMSDLYTDFRAIDDGKDTGAIADLLGVPDVETPAEQPRETSPARNGHVPHEPAQEPLRPSPEMLRELTERLSNLAIAKICQVSEAAVRKWLKEYRIQREGRVQTGKLSDVEVILLRSELRRAIGRPLVGRGGP
jgi:integrase